MRRDEEDLESELAEDAEAAEAADEEFRQVEAGGVFHDLAAEAQKPAGAIDEAHAEDEVALAAKAEPAGAAETGAERAAEGRAGGEQQGIERQILTARGEGGGDLAEGRAGEGGEGEFVGLVFRDAAEAEGGDEGDVGRGGGEARLGARADGENARGGAHGFGELGERGGGEQGVHSREMRPAFSSGCRPCWASAGAVPSGNILPGFAMPSGSKAARIRWRQSSSSALNIEAR